MTPNLYPHEIEATRIQAGRCPQCNRPMYRPLHGRPFACANKKCPVVVEITDWHQKEGYAIMRGTTLKKLGLKRNSLA